MTELLTIRCVRREPMDACPDCSQLILVALGKAQTDPVEARR